MGASRSCSCVLAEKGDTAQSMVLAGSQASISSLNPKDFQSWDFDVMPLDHGHHGSVQKAAAMILWSKQGVCAVGSEQAPAEEEKQADFARSVCARHMDNPYHNAQHALDVLHAVWRMGELLPWGQIYQLQEQYAIMVAALAHDIGHVGRTNTFLVDTKDELAIRYNDISPLEHMHCNKLFSILGVHKTNVFSHLSEGEFKNIRAMIIDAILFTDTVKHRTIIKDLQTLHADNAQLFCDQTQGPLRDEIAELCSKNKTCISRTLLHSADLSNPCKPWKIAFAWAQKLIDEFFVQGDQEKVMGMRIGLLNDRTTVSLPHSQLGLIQFMVAPLVASYARIFRNLWDLVDMLANNVGEWSRIYLEESGTDESNRVKVVRGMLESAKTAEAKATVDTLALAPQGSDKEDELAMMPWIAPDVTDDQQTVVVREVRRWQQQEEQIGPQRGQHRELALFYVLSDRDALATNEDILMKFNASQAHFIEPEREKVTRADGARVVPVAVAADNMRAQLNRKEFDVVLSTLLDKKGR